MKQIYNLILETFGRKPMTRPLDKKNFSFINFEIILLRFHNQEKQQPNYFMTRKKMANNAR